VDSSTFHFKTKIDLTVLLGIKATTLTDLLAGIKSVPDSSIYFHTHKFLLQHQFISPEPPNDFAFWVTNALNENILGERIASMELIRVKNVAELRKQLVDLIEGSLIGHTRVVDSPPGEEFHFMSSQTFVLESPYAACSLKEFCVCLNNVSTSSLFYHIFDARLRMNREENDFSEWFRRIGNQSLADAVRQIDPYAQSLESLRKNILNLMRIHAEH